MKTGKHRGSIVLRVALKIAILILLLSASSLAQVAIIVNNSVPLKSVEASTILNIYALNQKAWEDGTPIIPVILKGNESTTQIFYQYIGKSRLEMRKTWMRAQLSGEGRAPISLDSDEAVLETVASTPGAIGFVRAQIAGSNVRTVAIVQPIGRRE